MTDTSLTDILAADAWQTSHFFAFTDPVQQAGFEREMIVENYTLTVSEKSSVPGADTHPYLTVLERRETIHEDEADALALLHHLTARAEAYGGQYEGSESALPVDEEEMAALEAYIAALPKPALH
jgi:hypothetical protein